jgi:tetratricopeptide (TPR) repeat protein
MRNLAVLLTLVLFSLHALAQTPQPKSGNNKNPASKKLVEKEEFDRTVTLADAAERVAALRKFVKNFPKSKEKIRALELIASGRAALADEKFRTGEKEASIELFKLAVRETPKPVSDKLFAEVVLQIPNSLILRGEAKAAIEIARLIEEKAERNAKQLLGAAAFYLAMENAADAKRLVEKAVALDANLPAAYQTLGLAHRLDFQLEESAGAYQKALELDADSTISRRALAEMKRATGKAAEAVALYREILAKDANDAAQTGLILALLDTENKTEAESEMQKSLTANPSNLSLLVGAAYWYAAHDDGARAIELAEKAINIEPRYIWARIALARGLMQQKRSMEAEKTLLAARQYGDFPTLDYELATARFQSGFYREAAEGLRAKFSVAADGAIKTRLGGRVAKEAKSFTELLAAERRASIFQTLAADNVDNADKLKSLLDFSQKLDASGDEAAIAAADEFVKGDDRMKMHRQLFAADQLLQKRKALPKVYELTKAAIGGVDAALDVPHPAAAVLADELYQSRRIAISRNELIIVPDVPRKTLSNILRGRIEDIAGWTLFQENKSTEAVTRLKRAVSVLPEKSSWWRASMWRLGAAHEAAGTQTDALDAYIKSYTSGEADAIKYGIIETVYQKVNGNTDGLELKIGTKPASVASAFPVQTETKTTEPPKSTIVQSAPEIKPETAPTPNAGETAEPIAETKPPSEISEAEKNGKSRKRTDAENGKRSGESRTAN